MRKNTKYTQSPTYLVGHPFGLDLTSLTANIGRLLISLKDGTTLINPLALISDWNGSAYKATANKALEDYFSTIPLPDAEDLGFTKITGWNIEVDIAYELATDDTVVTLGSFAVANAKLPIPQYYKTGHGYLSSQIDVLSLRPKIVQAELADTDVLYFFNNLNPSPTGLKAKVFYRNTSGQLLSKIFAVNEEITGNSLYSLNVSAKHLGLDFHETDKYSIAIYDQDDVQLTHPIDYYPVLLQDAFATKLWYLSSLGVWEKYTFVGQTTKARELDTFRGEFNNIQTEFYTRSFENLALNTGKLPLGYQSYLEYQLSHTKKMYIQEPDGTFREVVKTFKNLKTYNNQENEEFLEIELRYVETEV